MGTEVGIVTQTRSLGVGSGSGAVIVHLLGEYGDAVVGFSELVLQLVVLVRQAFEMRLSGFDLGLAELGEVEQCVLLLREGANGRF